MAAAKNFFYNNIILLTLIVSSSYHHQKTIKMKISTLLVLCPVLFIIASCKKDKTNNNSVIEGTYKFKSAHIQTNSTIAGTDGEKAITISDYITINNAGTIVIDASNINTTGLSYEVNASAKGYFYQDNALTDSFSSPFNYTLPPMNTTGAYKLISSDSIFFPHGSIASIGSSTADLSGPSGGKYSMTGSLLTITQNASTDSTFIISGVSFHKSETAQASILLEKQ